MNIITRAEQQAARQTHTEQRERERVEVAAHYEHDPAIFSLVLDSQLTYSTGIFLDATDDLETAQQRKFARVRQLLAIQPDEHVLDVGCGWGSILLDLGRHSQGTLRGITLSERQRAVALERARERGLAARVRIDHCHVEDLDLLPESIDVVLFSGSIVHMHNREEIYQLVGE